MTHLVPYDGAENWEIKRQGWQIIVKSDGGQARIVGVTWPQGVSLESQLQPAAGIPLADEISLEIRDPIQLQQLAALPHRVGAVVVRKLLLDRDALIQIANTEPRAFLGSLKEADIDVLEQFRRVETLNLYLRNVAHRAHGNGRVGVAPLPLPRIPTLRSLFIQTPVLPPDLLRTLSSIAPGIQLLEGEATHSRALFAEWDGLDQLHNLEAISVGWAVHLKAEEVARVPNLRFLYYGTGGIHNSDPGLPDLEKKKGLQTLFHLNPNFPASALTCWAESGGLVEVDSCKTYGAVDFARLPQLRYLFMRRKTNNRVAVDFSSIQKLKHLQHFSLDLPSQEELVQIGQLANCEQIEGLNLWHGSFHNLSVLHRLRSLRRFEIRGHDGPLRQLDLRAFPKLEVAYISGNQDLKAIDGVAGHPVLQSLELALNEGLISLGPTESNSTLRSVRIQGCRDLPNLDAFSECKGLRQVVITDCDGLTGPLPFNEMNSLEYYTVTKCDHLAERSQKD